MSPFLVRFDFFQEFIEYGNQSFAIVGVGLVVIDLPVNPAMEPIVVVRPPLSSSNGRKALLILYGP